MKVTFVQSVNHENNHKMKTTEVVLIPNAGCFHINLKASSVFKSKMKWFFIEQCLSRPRQITSIKHSFSLIGFSTWFSRTLDSAFPLFFDISSTNRVYPIFASCPESLAYVYNNPLYPILSSLKTATQTSTWAELAGYMKWNKSNNNKLRRRTKSYLESDAISLTKRIMGTRLI